MSTMRPVQIEVGIGEVKLAQAPGEILVAYGLGSCVALVMYHALLGVAGMAHILLPSNGTGPVSMPGKYADVAVETLKKMLVDLGVPASGIRAKLSGGAKLLDLGPLAGKQMEVGQRNVEAVLRVLDANAVPVLGKDVGGRHARTVRFDPSTGIMLVKTANGIPKEI